MISPNGLRKERWILTGVVLLGLVHGLIFVFVMPPWQHYEEPSHFEYAWLIASRQSLPEYPAYDQSKRREIAASMIKHGFFNGLGFLPDLDSQAQPIWIGINVTGALPLYHILVALPLRFILNADVDTQLYAARLVSLALYLSTIWLAYKVLCEFVPLGHPLRWIVPGTMALLPGFTDLMTAVNNDVGATFVFSLFLLASVRLILRGFSLGRFIGVLVAAGVCLLTKNTVLVAFPLVLLAVVLALHRSRWWIAACALFFVASIIATVSVFSWGDASLWYRDSMQEKPTQARRSEAPVGNYAIGLETPLGSAETSRVSQPLLADQVQELKGKTVTIGAWIWATAPTQAQLPMLSDGYQASVQQVNVDVRPSFHASQVMIAKDADRVSVILQAVPTQGQNEAVTVFYDGIILLEGEWPLETPPVFDDPRGEQGNWGNRQFRNRIRNASAEWAWPFVQPWVEMLSKRFPWAAHLSPTSFVNALLDLQNSSGIYRATVSRLFQTFWGYFGWGHISLPSICYQVLKWITVLSLLTFPLGLWSIGRMKSMSWKLTMAWLGFAMLTIWSSVFIRALPSLFGQIYIPTARYGYPAIIPTMMFLSIGWCAGLPSQRWLKLCTYLYFVGFLVLDLISIMTIVSFYKGG
ncbi:MAG: DUF2142 domain-containing protein [Chloroflexota bacterium]|nr:DUF2142 domain-containing protein [Chloroflexota bacterium]